ncbi:MAG: hypothetical protein GX364_03325 [Firmicutes bacterium]|jgi:hypothetical protein|nr:hypothetical protein [Bacillota bacterium]
MVGLSFLGPTKYLKANRLEKWRNRNERLAVEKELGLIAKVTFRKQNDKNCNVLPDWYEKDSQSNSIAHIWNMLLNLRNDIAHCAMNTNAASSGTIRNNTKNLIPALGALLDF